MQQQRARRGTPTRCWLAARAAAKPPLPAGFPAGGASPQPLDSSGHEGAPEIPVSIVATDLPAPDPPDERAGEVEFEGAALDPQEIQERLEEREGGA